MSIATDKAALDAAMNQLQTDIANHATQPVIATDCDAVIAAATQLYNDQTPAPPPDPRVTIVTPFDSIPNFGRNPNIQSIHNGNWSDPATWNLGRVPVAGDVVSISGTTTVAYDVAIAADAVLTDSPALKCIVVQAGALLRWRHDVHTRVLVSNFLILEGGQIEVGTEAQPIQHDLSGLFGPGCEIVFTNKPIDTTIDPAQYGNGLVVLGKLTAWGMENTSFARLAVEPKVGDMSLVFAEPVSGWHDKDRLIIPDTRQLDSTHRFNKYDPQTEVTHAVTVSADNKTVTLDAPLLFSHLGARNPDGVLEFLPHVGNLSKSVQFRSEKSSIDATRGHCMFLHRADVKIHNVLFHGLGRTTESTADNTTFNTNGTVKHVGTNQVGRHCVNFRNLFGPATPAGPYQFELVGCSIFDTIRPSTPFLWGVVLDNAHYGLLEGNFLYNWAGSGFMNVTGNETENLFRRNFVTWTHGKANPRNNDGRDAAAFWAHGSNNRYIGNVAANTIVTLSGIVSGVGFKFVAPSAPSMTTRIPLGPGKDTSVASQYRLVDQKAMPIIQFEDNETYGATAGGLTIWYLDAIDIAQTVIKDFTAWHCYEEGCFAYPINNFLFDGFVVRGLLTLARSTYSRAYAGWMSGDYTARNVVIRRADIQGYNQGFALSSCTPGDLVIEDSFFRCYTSNIMISSQATPGTRAAMSPRRTFIRNCRFAPIPGQPAYVKIVLVDDHNARGNNYLVKDEVFVEGFNGVPGDDFQVYYLEQKADAILPPRTYRGVGIIDAEGCHDGATPWPNGVTGLTNQQAWDQFGQAWAGAISPADATTWAGIVGLVK